jgi:hypothetical protein
MMPTSTAKRATKAKTQQTSDSVLRLSGSRSTGAMPLRQVVQQLPPGSFEIVDDRGTVVAVLNKLQPSLADLVCQQLSPEEMASLRRRIGKPAVVSSYEEVRKRVFSRKR